MHERSYDFFLFNTQQNKYKTKRRKGDRQAFMDTQFCNGFQTAYMFYLNRNFDNSDEIKSISPGTKAYHLPDDMLLKITSFEAVLRPVSGRAVMTQVSQLVPRVLVVGDCLRGHNKYSELSYR